DHAPDADSVCKLERGNVARLSEGAAQGDEAFKFFVVVVRRVRAGGSFEADRLVENGVVGAGALIDDRSVNVGLERRADLTQGLGGAVEFGVVEVASADHGL